MACKQEEEKRPHFGHNCNGMENNILKYGTKTQIAFYIVFTALIILLVWLDISGRLNAY